MFLSLYVLSELEHIPIGISFEITGHVLVPTDEMLRQFSESVIHVLREFSTLLAIVHHYFRKQGTLSL